MPPYNGKTSPGRGSRLLHFRKQLGKDRKFWICLLFPLLFSLVNFVALILVMETLSKNNVSDIFAKSLQVGLARNDGSDPYNYPVADSLLMDRTGSQPVQKPNRTPSFTEPDKGQPFYNSLQLFFEIQQINGSLQTLFVHHTRIIWDYNTEEAKSDATDSPGHPVDDDFVPVSHHNRTNANRCRSTLFEKRYHRPTCNSFQELGLESLIRQDMAKYFDSGSLSDVFSIAERIYDNNTSSTLSKFIMKGYKYRNRRRPLGFLVWKRTRRDAMISAAVGPHPLIVSTYGYCGMNSFGEFVPYGNAETIAPEDYPFCSERGGEGAMNLSNVMRQPLLVANNFSVVQKLQFSLDMAESLALLHNHKDGVLIHSDVWMAQFLFSDWSKTRLKLNDFNNGEIMQFDEHEQKYCRFRKEFSADYSLAPEERSGIRSGEERDVYRFGNNMYYILTGYNLYPQVCESSKKDRLLEQNKTSFIDRRWRTRSPGEHEMVRLIRDCWQPDPKDRPSIGAVVLKLRSSMQNQKNWELWQEFKRRRFKLLNSTQVNETEAK